MKKRLLSALLALCMMLTMAPTVAFAVDGDSSASTGYGANLDGITVGVENPDAVGASEDALAAELERGLPNSAAININKTGATNMVYNIGEDTVLMISGSESETPIVFKDCTFNLSGGTDRISGNQDGISYNNGEVVTKLWIGGNVQFENCKFVTAQGATKTTSAGYDASIYFFSGDIQLDNCLLQAEDYNGQFLGLYGSEGAVTFNNCDIGTVNNKNGWSYAMYAGSVLKLNNSTMTATGMSTDSGNINAFYSGDNRTGYDAIYATNSIIDFSDNEAGGFAINNVNIHVDNSQITVSDNLGNACNSGYWIVSDSDITINGNRGGHGLSCIGFEMTGSDVEILHNGYAGVYIQSRDSSLTNCEVDLRCNGEKLLSYTAGDLWLNGHKLTVSGGTSNAQSGSAWLGGVGRKGAVETAEDTSVVAYDLNSNAADNLKSNTAPVLTNATLALNGTENQHTLFLNPFMTTDYARGNGENSSSDNDADLFADDHVTSPSDILGSDNAKIGVLTTAQLSHHIYDWSTVVETQAATADTYGFAKYACTECDGYTGHTADHVYSFDCDATYVYAPLVGLHFEANTYHEVSNMPEDQTQIAYRGTATAPATEPAMENYTFTGWYLDKDCTQKVDWSTQLTANWTTVYAGWERNVTPDYEQPAIDKTATELDGNDQTEVTLNVGGDQDVENVAVLFVLDYSTSVDVRAAAADMLDELASKENTNIKASVINYWADADEGTWTTVTAETDTDQLLAQTQTDGTNYHAGLVAAEAALQSDEIAGYETYLITISDGITYLWTNDDVNDPNYGETMSVWFQNIGNGADDIQNANSVYDMKYKGAPIDSSTFAALMNGTDEVVEKYNRTVEKGVLYGGAKPASTETDQYWALSNADVFSGTLINNEIAIYKTAQQYKKLLALVDNAYAFKLDENHWENYPYGEQLMDYLADISKGGEISETTAADTFAGIKDEILYAIQSGTVIDVIGDDFDLANVTDTYDLVSDTFVMTVGGEAQPATLSETDGKTVYFGTPNEAGEYPYSVTYNPNGTDAEAREHFVWNIHVPVEKRSGLSLTYSLDLVNKETASGTYTPPTNEEAVLEYVTSTGDNDKLTFPVPTVSYTISGRNPGGNNGSSRPDPDDLNTEDHFAYIIGYPEDYRTGEPTDDESLWPVQPQGDITRAEVATIFFRMLTDTSRSANWSQTNNYTDVASTDWYNNAISTLTNMGIISGDPDGSFRPNDSITRAEFTKIAVGFFDEVGNYVDGTYSDVSADAWYADFIDAAVDLGLIEGYLDGTIRPNATITRAEACTIVNRTLNRVPDKDHLLPTSDMRVWPDNSDTNAWYYAQMQEATNSHDYEWIGEENDQIENWTEKLEDRDWAQLEREWSDANSAPGGEVMD